MSEKQDRGDAPKQRYRKVDPRIWNDARFNALSDSGKLVFFLLLTHPHMTAVGAMRATIPGLASELGWTAEAFREAFGEALREGMIEHDENACFLSLPKFLKYNNPQSPNVVIAWKSAADLLPECDMKTQVIQRAKAFAEGMGKAFGEAFTKAFPESGVGAGAGDRKAPRREKNPFPEDFSPSEETKNWAKKNGFASFIPQHLSYFADYARSSGKRYADWDAAFRNCIKGDWGNVRKGQKQDPTAGAL